MKMIYNACFRFKYPQTSRNPISVYIYMTNAERGHFILDNITYFEPSTSLHNGGQELRSTGTTTIMTRAGQIKCSGGGRVNDHKRIGLSANGICTVKTTSRTRDGRGITHNPAQTFARRGSRTMHGFSTPGGDTCQKSPKTITEELPHGCFFLAFPSQ